MNELSQPQMVNHVCAVHGLQLQAPPSMNVTCRCGLQCEVDVQDWVATQRDHYTDEDIGELAKQAGLPVAELLGEVG